MGFQYGQDALANSALAGRLTKFGLELHPDKTRVLKFGRFARKGRESRGHYQYYGVPTNSSALTSFQRAVGRLWHGSLQRRSQRAPMTRAKLRRFEERFPLPLPRIVHPWPERRFATR